MSENDEILPAQTGTVPKASREPNFDTAQEIHPVTFFNKDFSLNGNAPTDADLEAGAYDFRPKSPEHMALVDAELEEDAPKDSSAQESAESSQSQTTTATESPASPEQTVPAEKDNGQHKEEESGTQTSSDPKTTGSNEQPV